MSLPAELYMFEDAWETAVSMWLENNGVNDPKKQREHNVDVDGQIIALKTPRVEAKFLFAGFGREHYHVNQSTKEKWPDIGDGVGYLKIVTRRNVSEPSHAYLRGLCRYLMQFSQQISARMENHQIEKMLESSSTVMVEADKHHDVSALSFQTSIRIISNKFPV